jgi:hypothetical protein
MATSARRAPPRRRRMRPGRGAAAEPAGEVPAAWRFPSSQIEQRGPITSQQVARRCDLSRRGCGQFNRCCSVVLTTEVCHKGVAAERRTAWNRSAYRLWTAPNELIDQLMSNTGAGARPRRARRTEVERRRRCASGARCACPPPGEAPMALGQLSCLAVASRQQHSGPTTVLSDTPPCTLSRRPGPRGAHVCTKLSAMSCAPAAAAPPPAPAPQ